MPDDNKLSIWKPIIIPLEGFKYIHSPYNESLSDEVYLFAGRDVIRDKLVALLDSKTHQRGSYLISGYRGVGKTSIVNRAIHKYKESETGSGKKSAIILKINLGDNSTLRPFDIYFSIANFLLEETRYLGKKNSPRKKLNELVQRMGHQISETRSVSAGISGTFNAIFSLLGSKQTQTIKLPITVRDAEEKLLHIIKELTEGKRIIFIFDEIDKLSNAEVADDFGYLHKASEKSLESKSRDKSIKVNTLLGALKNFITTAEAIFFFISGRETLDKYYSEKGSPNSLYESIFDQVFEIPSLLTDKKYPQKVFQITFFTEEYLCRRLMKKYTDEERKKIKESDYYNIKNYLKHHQNEWNETTRAENRLLASTLRNFIYYLVFHSWGNPKRLTAIFESFVIKNNDNGDNNSNAKYALHFDISQLRTFALAAELITLFQHQFSREVSRISDKLTVTSLSSLQFIMKHYAYGFSRDSLHHMAEAMNVHRSPSFNTIVDDLLTQTFKSYIRRIRNGVYRYRFHSEFEQELRYASHVTELESAAYTFSLDSMRQVKQLFKSIPFHTSQHDKILIWKSHVSLGDICALEQSYNEAATHYHSAINHLKKELYSEFDFDSHVLIHYVEVMIKMGDLEEHRQNYASAAAFYTDAKTLVEKKLPPHLSSALKEGDSKWDILKQPIWAIGYLSLKRSPKKNCIVDNIDRYYHKDDPRRYFRAANLAFFSGDFKCARTEYKKTRTISEQKKSSLSLSERYAYLKGNAIVGLVETNLVITASEFYCEQCDNGHQTTPVYANKLTHILNHQYNNNESSIYMALIEAAEIFENNRIYISAAITYMKVIAYLSAMLDGFENGTSHNLTNFIAHFQKTVVRNGEAALRCINKARQLESAQQNKTLLVTAFDCNSYKDKKNLNITQLIHILLRHPTDSPQQHLHEEVYWQQSLWTHKLLAVLIWAKHVYLKAQGLNDELQIPSNMSTLSVRPAIILRWLYARDLCRRKIDGQLILKKNNKDKFKPCYRLQDIFENCRKTPNTLKHSKEGMLLSHYLFTIDNRDYTNNNNTLPDSLIHSYAASRNLYFALSSIRIISRRNMDLIFPRLSQIYFTQWKILANLISVLLIDKKDSSNYLPTGINSVRDASFFVQRTLLAVDKAHAEYEGIPPTHLDYEYIYLRLCESLDSAASLVDNTSRARMGIFQNKYYCHDDYTDPGFRMDYTLAYIFTPHAVSLRQYVEDAHKALEDIFDRT